MNNNILLAILWKEWIIFKKRILLILPLTLVFLIILILGILFRVKPDTADPLAISLLICVYISFLTSIFTARFGSEKLNGTIEYLFSLPVKFRTIILFKLIFPLSISLAAGLISNIILDIIFLFMRIDISISIFLYQMLISFLSVLLIIFPLSLINGISIWFINKTISIIFQIINYMIILIGISSILSLNLALLSNLLYVFITIIVILWSVALILFSSIKKEKAILLIDKK